MVPITPRRSDAGAARTAAAAAALTSVEVVLAVVLAAILAAAPAAAQQKLLTLDDIFDPVKRVNFSGHPPDLAWIDGSRYAWARESQNGTGPESNGRAVDWLKVDAATASTQPLFDPDRMQSALAKLPGLEIGDLHRLAHSRNLTFNAAYSAALLTIAGDLYVYEFGADRAIRLTHAPDRQELPSFSPDGSRVAFIRDNNLFVVDVAAGREIALTRDGAGRIANGKLDWVYEEEIYGRGHRRAYWWSPDSSAIAFLRVDDTPVSSYVTLDDIPYDPKIERWDYPRAGDPNPVVTLGFVRIHDGRPHWIDASKYPADDRLIVRVGWTPDSARIVYEVQNRTQTWLDLNLFETAAGTTRTLVHEASKYWIDAETTSLPVWLKDGSLLWLSERSGWKHLYRYSADGSLMGAITSGKWELRTLHGIDEPRGWIYFSGTEHSAIGSDIYRIRLDGTSFQRLSAAEGTHAARFSPDFSWYLDAWSDATTPIQTTLFRSEGREARVVDANPVPALSEYRLSRPEFVRVTTRDGFVMEAEMIKPPDFNPVRRYPVYQATYGGPHAPMVRNSWGGVSYLYHQLLAQNGIIVWICDNRTASGKGVESVWPLYKHFGESELRDIEDGLAWLKQQPYVDGTRIGIHGWSYGGFMTSYALTHSTSFVMGIAGGTVADWRDYDTVYTERYMGLPRENQDGYRNSSPRWSAKNLHGALLLIHGAIDDNVHPQNTMQFAYELQKAEQPFELMIYPKSRHGIADPALAKHLRSLMLTFTLEHLKAADPGRTTTSAR